VTDHISIPDLCQAIERGLRLQSDKDPWGGAQLHCSDMGDALPGGCLRRVWLRINGAEKSPDKVGTLWMFARGNQIHETLTPLLTAGLGDGWEVVGREIPVGAELAQEFGIEAGTLDLLLLHRATWSLLVVDYKSIKVLGMARLSSPKEDNVVQVRGYSEVADKWAKRTAWGEGKPLSTIGAIVIYADREGQGGFKGFFVRRDREMVEQAAARLRELREMKDPPPGCAPQGKNQNFRCQYRTQDGETTTCGYLDISCPGSLKLAAEQELLTFDLEEALKASLAKGGKDVSAAS
jgi:hypothetical protein